MTIKPIEPYSRWSNLLQMNKQIDAPSMRRHLAERDARDHLAAVAVGWLLRPAHPQETTAMRDALRDWLTARDEKENG